jgi:hypothetical protein
MSHRERTKLTAECETKIRTIKNSHQDLYHSHPPIFAQQIFHIHCLFLETLLLKIKMSGVTKWIISQSEKLPMFKKIIGKV